MNRRRILLGVPWLAAASLVSFSMGSAMGCKSNDGPVDPVWGKEPCAYCRMLISERRYAAQAIDSGDRYYFDDIGCMVLWQRKHTAALLWVHQSPENKWLNATVAKYKSGVSSPMDFGFESSNDGSVSWADVSAAVLQKEGKRQ